jgi:lycopene cyclase domain-containing protein
MWTYLWIDLGAFAVPFLFSFHPRLRFDRQWHAAWPAILGMMLLFIPWDAWATSRGIWGFDPEHLVGPNLLGLPIEEWLFFICIPYACLFTYHCFNVLGVKDYLRPYAKGITRGLIAASVLIAVFFTHQLYTCITFALLAFFLVMVTLWSEPQWMGRAYFTYVVLLVPFLIVNGLLTGTGMDQPVVWYDEAHILGLRIISIPVEDVFYGLLMFLLTALIHEALLARKGKAQSRPGKQLPR